MSEIRRRALLATLAGACGGIALGTIWRPGRKAGDLALRPPGAEAEVFASRCVRCGACVRACPERLIRDGKLAEELAPVVEFVRGRRCRIDCTACADVCPTGALRLRSPADKAARPIGTVVVENGSCRSANGMGCGLCVQVCPHQALRMVSAEGRSLIAVDASRCTGCGYCLDACPVGALEVEVIR